MVIKMDQKDTSDWVIVCRNPKCKHRYPIPEECPVEWKTKKFRGVCGHGEDTIFPELIEPVECPKCGEKSYRVIRKHFKSKIGPTCSI